MTDRTAPTGGRPAPDRVPDVTVIVIAYNDAANLPTAVESVLTQTLHNLEVLIIDDASTDSTPQVADGLAASRDRVRAVHLPVNSGGCSRPRNVGLDRARAPHVMFLDSDDTYERHACKNLLVAAERTGADVVSGLCHRVNLTTGASRPWWGVLYRQRAVYEGIEAFPDQLYDTTSTNKLYRRDFLDDNGLRFPEGYHYEDLLFTTEVYCTARRIAVIPNLVYRWNFVDRADEPSISNRRAEITNFRDRLAIHRKIDAYLEARGLEQLEIVKDRKFIRHDLRLYLNDLAKRDPDYQREFLDMARDYLRTVDPRALQISGTVERIGAFMILQGDLTETLKVVDYLQRKGTLSTDLYREGGRVYWTRKYLDTPDGRSVLDITALGLQHLPLDRLVLYNRGTQWDVRGSTLALGGVITVPLNRLTAADRLDLWLVFRNRKSGRQHTVPVTQWQLDGARLRWSTAADVDRTVIVTTTRQPIWDVSVRVTRGAESVSAPVNVLTLGVDGARLVVHPRRSVLLGNRLECHTTGIGNLALRLVNTSRAGVGAARALRRLRRTRAVVLAAQIRTRLRGKETKTKFYRLAGRLPVRKGTVVFESHLGKQYSDSPKYIYQAMVAAGGGYRAVWSYTGNPAAWPTEAVLVRRESWRYYYELARAEFWVDNQGFPRQFRKRAGTTYLQTWHGTPLKTMGFDEPGLAALPPAQQREHAAMIERWDALVVPSDYFIDTFVRAYRYSGPLLRVGYPRNDPLVTGNDPGTVKELRERLHLPDNRKIVLYAPTFRDTQHHIRARFQLRLDLQALAEALGEEYYFLIRTHYLDRVSIPATHRPLAANLSKHHDVTELMLASDVLITDYSSILFDYANLRRPMIFFTYDYEDYLRTRGTYFDLASTVPGPQVATTAEVIDCLRNLDDVQIRFRERYEQFHARFCQYDTGTASTTIVRQYLPGPRA